MVEPMAWERLTVVPPAAMLAAPEGSVKRRAVGRKSHRHAAGVGVGGEDDVGDPALVRGDDALGGACLVSERGGDVAGGDVDGVPADVLLPPPDGAEMVVLILARGVVMVTRVGVVEAVDRVLGCLGRLPANALVGPAERHVEVPLLDVGGEEVLARPLVVDAVHLDGRLARRGHCRGRRHLAKWPSMVPKTAK